MTYAVLIKRSPSSVTERRIAELEAEVARLTEALESAVESANSQADLVSEWSSTNPTVYTVEDFLS